MQTITNRKSTQLNYKRHTSSLNIPAGILVNAGVNMEEFAQEVKRRAALDMYKKEELSFGQAAELAELNKEDFLNYLAVSQVSLFDFNENDLEEELS